MRISFRDYGTNGVASQIKPSDAFSEFTVAAKTTERYPYPSAQTGSFSPDNDVFLPFYQKCLP